MFSKGKQTFDFSKFQLQIPKNKTTVFIDNSNPTQKLSIRISVHMSRQPQNLHQRTVLGGGSNLNPYFITHPNSSTYNPAQFVHIV